MRICYLGAYNTEYPRNQILRAGLAQQGVEVVMVNAPRYLPTWRKVPFLSREFSRQAAGCQAIVLAEFGQSLAGLAWALARRQGVPLVVDFFTSMYDTAVEDRQQLSGGGFGARRMRLIDRVALRVADAVLVDTVANADYIVEEFGAEGEKINVIAVGAFAPWFHPDVVAARARGDKIQVRFFGTYIPLHGIDTILGAAYRLRGRADIHFELLGRGQTYDEMMALAAKLELPNVTFLEPVAPGDLPVWLAGADICLGILATPAKPGGLCPTSFIKAWRCANR